MTHDEGPRPLIDGEEISWAVRLVAVAVVLPFAAFYGGVIGGLVALGFERVYGG